MTLPGRAECWKASGRCRRRSWRGRQHRESCCEAEAIVGDLLMGGWLGGPISIGQPCHIYSADDLRQIQEANVKKILDLGATKFFLGHGGPLDSHRVREWLGRVGSG